jgi:hypothetical protein
MDGFNQVITKGGNFQISVSQMVMLNYFQGGWVGGWVGK